jgi:hypothetical protein
MTAEGLPDQEPKREVGIDPIPDMFGCFVWIALIGTTILAAAFTLGIIVRVFRWAAGI